MGIVLLPFTDVSTISWRLFALLSALSPQLKVSAATVFPIFVVEPGDLFFLAHKCSFELFY